MRDNRSMTFQPLNLKPGCELCAASGGVLIWTSQEWRAVRVEDASHPAFYRIISNRHVREFSDLASDDRIRCMALVSAIERVLIDALNPTKVNLAAFGNMVAHLHWHIVARFEWDSHFPNPIWGERLRETTDAAARLALPLSELDAAVVRALAVA